MNNRPVIPCHGNENVFGAAPRLPCVRFGCGEIYLHGNLNYDLSHRCSPFCDIKQFDPVDAINSRFIKRQTLSVLVIACGCNQANATIEDREAAKECERQMLPWQSVHYSCGAVGRAGTFGEDLPVISVSLGSAPESRGECSPRLRWKGGDRV